LRIPLPLRIALIIIREGSYRSGNSISLVRILLSNILLFIASIIMSFFLIILVRDGDSIQSYIKVSQLVYIFSFFTLSIINYRSIKDTKSLMPILMLPIRPRTVIAAVIIAHLLWGGLALSPLLIPPYYTLLDFRFNAIFILVWLSSFLAVLGTILGMACVEISFRRVPWLITLSWVGSIILFTYLGPLLTILFSSSILERSILLIGYFYLTAMAFGRVIGRLHEFPNVAPAGNEYAELPHMTLLKKELILIRRRPWILALILFSVFPHSIITIYTSEVSSNAALLNLTLASLLELGVILPLFTIWLYSLEGSGSSLLYILPLTKLQVSLSKYALYVIICLAINIPIVVFSLISGGNLVYYLTVFIFTVISFSSLYNLLICRLLPKRESMWTFQSIGWLKLTPIMVVAESVFIMVFLESLNGFVVDVGALYSAFLLIDTCILLLSLFMLRYLCDVPL